MTWWSQYIHQSGSFLQYFYSFNQMIFFCMASTISFSLEVKPPLLSITKSQLQFIYSRKSEIRWGFSSSVVIQSRPGWAKNKSRFGSWKDIWLAAATCERSTKNPETKQVFCAWLVWNLCSCFGLVPQTLNDNLHLWWHTVKITLASWIPHAFLEFGGLLHWIIKLLI